LAHPVHQCYSTHDVFSGYALHGRGGKIETERNGSTGRSCRLAFIARLHRAVRRRRAVPPYHERSALGEVDSHRELQEPSPLPGQCVRLPVVELTRLVDCHQRDRDGERERERAWRHDHRTSRQTTQSPPPLKPPSIPRRRTAALLLTGQAAFSA